MNCLHALNTDRNEVKQGPPVSSFLARTSYCVVHLPHAKADTLAAPSTCKPSSCLSTPAPLSGTPGPSHMHSRQQQVCTP